VYLKIQPYIQSSVAPRTNQKLSFRYYGPFTVIDCVGAVAYKLQLPAACRIHPVVHISELKRHVPPSVRIEDDITQIPDDPNVQDVPIHALLGKGSRVVHQILVQWNSLPASLATWEEAKDLHQRFPKCPAWDQAGF